MKTYYQHTPSRRICTLLNYLGQSHVQFQDNGQIQPLTRDGLYSFNTLKSLESNEN